VISRESGWRDQGLRGGEEAISPLPEEEQEDAAYAQFEAWMSPLLKMGLRIEVDEEGKTTIRHARFPALRLPVPYESEKDSAIMLEMQSRFELEKYGEDD